MSRDPGEREVFHALLRTDFRAFSQLAFRCVNPGQAYLPNWHMDAMAYHLQLAFERQIRRLIINVPPRSGKSLLASIAFPAWGLGRDPSLRFMCISYAQPLANKLARDTRLVVEDRGFRDAFPEFRWGGRNADAEMVTTRNGYRYAASIGGSLTGLGANFIIIDDPIKADGVMSEAERTTVNETYDGTIVSRLDNKNEDVIIIVHQRLHENDLTGHVRERDDWTILELPAIAPEPRTYSTGPSETYARPAGEVLHAARDGPAVLDRLKQSLGSNAFSAQYQQAPVPLGGVLIKCDWIQRYPRSALPDQWDDVIQSWDTASSISETADYSVGLTFGLKNRTAHLLDVTRGRWAYPELKRRVYEYRDRWSATLVLVEKASSGLPLGQDLYREGSIRPLQITPRGDKISRVEMHSAKIEAGHVLVPEEAPWLHDFLHELLRFPSGRHDDQVDALTQFLEYYGRKQRSWSRQDEYERRAAQRRRTDVLFPNGTWDERRRYI